MSEEELTDEAELVYEEEPVCEEEAMYEEEPLYDEEPPCGEVLVFESLGDIYVCSNCGYPLTEIPSYNRFYCENCGLHY